MEAEETPLERWIAGLSCQGVVYLLVALVIVACAFDKVIGQLLGMR